MNISSNEIQNLIGSSPTIQSIREKISNLSEIEVPVYIQGEAGTGKNLIATLIANEKLVSIDSSNFISDWNILIQKYTQKTAKSLQFRGENIKLSTPIYFDNIELLDNEGQAILFRILESQDFITVKKEQVQILSRIFLSSNKNLPQMVKDGLFRKDLFQKINLIRINTPALREIKSDIPILVNYFVTEFKTKYKKNILKLSEKLIQFILQYNWPGNVAQLRSMLEGMIVLSSDKILDISHVPKDFLTISALTSNGKISIIPGIPMLMYEKEIIRENLKSTNGNREKCAKILGISERTLYRKIKEFDLE